MKVFGLTGGIGMGKTAAGIVLRERRIPLADADLLARRAVEPGQPALRQIQETFGSKVIDPQGRLLREELARVIFSDAAARRKLEDIIHPRVRNEWRGQLETWRRERRPVAVVVIPLLFETGAEAELNRTICVACSAVTQRRRLSERGWSAEQIDQRLAAQWDIEKKMARADYVVWSEGPLEILEEQLRRIIPD